MTGSGQFLPSIWRRVIFNSSVLAAILSLEHQILVHQVQSKYWCQIINSANFNTVLDFWWMEKQSQKLNFSLKLGLYQVSVSRKCSKGHLKVFSQCCWVTIPVDSLIQQLILNTTASPSRPTVLPFSKETSDVTVTENEISTERGVWIYEHGFMACGWQQFFCRVLFFLLQSLFMLLLNPYVSAPFCPAHSVYRALKDELCTSLCDTELRGTERACSMESVGTMR